MNEPRRRKVVVAAPPRRPPAELRGIRVIVEDDTEPDVSYLTQEGFEDRREAHAQGEFTVMVVRIEADVRIEDTDQTLVSPGLRGVESDLAQEELDEIISEEWISLRVVLKTVGVPTAQLPLEIDPKWIESFWQQAEQWGMDAPEEDLDDENWEWPAPSQTDIEERAQKITDDRLSDPMQYLEELYGDEATKQAMEIAGVDVAAAAEDAVDTDGPEHFLARYDGNYHETPSGFIYWRSN